MTSDYVEECKKLKSGYRECTICQIYSPSSVSYDLKCGDVILMPDICLSCMLKHSIDLQNHYRIPNPIQLPTPYEMNIKS